uniref:ethanolamine kinase n=1 Tax=Strigamia maritima TaxID=126957 RepID=T1J443_STRMM
MTPLPRWTDPNTGKHQPQTQKFQSTGIDTSSKLGWTSMSNYEPHLPNCSIVFTALCSDPSNAGYFIMIFSISVAAMWVVFTVYYIAKSLSLYGCCPEVYASFENGLCYRFIKGVDLDYKTVRTENIARLVCQQTVKMHLVDISSHCSKEPCLFPKLKNFLSLIPHEYLNGSTNHCLRPQLPSRAILEAEVKFLEGHLTKLKSPIVFCHNDLLLKNIIFEEESNSVKFIDLEYASYNYQAFDIGNHFCEFAGVDTVDYTKYPDREFQRNWLRIFLGFWFQAQGRDQSEVTANDVNLLYVQVNKFALASHMMWGLWSIVQSIHSTINFDYITQVQTSEYAAIRLGEYFNRKDEFLSLQLPLD